MRERNFINWIQNQECAEAYLLYYSSTAPWPSGLQEIEIRVWWPINASLEGKARLKMSGFVDEWLKKGRLEKIRYITLNPDYYRKIKKSLLISHFWQESKQIISSKTNFDVSISEFEGWHHKGETVEKYCKYTFYNLNKLHCFHHLQNTLFQLLPESFSPPEA
jgi:hypothetical protein